jgi:ubiquitin C-terminal hydrolase
MDDTYAPTCAACRYKNEARIRVDATIDVGPHASAGWDSSSTQHAAAPELYTLTAVVCHIGNANSGHYVCYRRRLGVDGHTSWVLTSDERVITVPFSTVQLAGGAYLAFYEQCPAPMVDIVADHTGVSTTPD